MKGETKKMKISKIGGGNEISAMKIIVAKMKANIS
jgi:hypothetical protein